MIIAFLMQSSIADSITVIIWAFKYSQSQSTDLQLVYLIFLSKQKHVYHKNLFRRFLKVNLANYCVIKSQRPSASAQTLLIIETIYH